MRPRHPDPLAWVMRFAPGEVVEVAAEGVEAVHEMTPATPPAAAHAEQRSTCPPQAGPAVGAPEAEWPFRGHRSMAEVLAAAT